MSQCWGPAALSAKPGERKIVKLDGAPEVQPVKRNLVPFEATPAALAGSIRSVKIANGRKLVALTFDLCETHGQVAGYDGEIIDTLRRLGAKATFFAGGKWMLDHDERSQQLMADARFEIGNHSWSHANERRVGPESTVREIRRTQAAYEQVREQFGQNQCAIAQPAAYSQIPQRLGLYRFPYGACNADGLNAVAEQGLLEIQWDIAMADPVAAQTADIIVTEVMRRVHPGAIIIGHANGHGVHTNEALQSLIPKLRAAGYEFVTVSELLAAGTPIIATECYNEKPGDLDRYDHKPTDNRVPADGKSSDANNSVGKVSDAKPRVGSPVTADTTSVSNTAVQVASKPRARKRAKPAATGNDWFGLFGPGNG